MSWDDDVTHVLPVPSLDSGPHAQSPEHLMKRTGRMQGWLSRLPEEAAFRGLGSEGEEN